MAYKTKRNKYYSKHFTKRRKYSGGNGLTVKHIFELGHIIKKTYKKNNKEMEETPYKNNRIQPKSTVPKSTVPKSTVSVEMFHDAYETMHGDGFYPAVSNRPQWTQITLEFMDEGNAWRQYSGERAINGLDGTAGKELLAKLNKEGGKNNLIIKSYVEQIYPKKSW